ncbi:hypothetical protein ACJIZ3_020422 [Penstemon smallii]|uniref:Avr9/Cf-9 rapidly elicited protein 146 n=1 Tax=Penstemon smallii TaxID=265156 RepID=A0ABD3SIS9_9LAMI
MYFMLKKGISKGKLIADLNIMMKRDKIAGKFAAIHKLMFHHHHHHHTAADSPDRHPIPENEVEFSCSNSPANKFHLLPFHLKKRRHSPVTDDVLMAMAFEMVNSTTASPALPGFGRTPMVRQLRVTDSPFPVREGIEEEDSRHVDEAAEEFIMKFHRDLRQQNAMAANY